MMEATFPRQPSSSSCSLRPASLKQRTSSLDTRRDYSHGTWTSLWGLIKVREFFVTVDHFSIWRRHLAWAIQDGRELRTYMTQRYGSNMVFMSLLLSTELAVLFNSAAITTSVREQLQVGAHGTVSFWAGFMMIVSALLTILSLLTTFTAWAMTNAVDPHNIHCIFRSSIGQYAAELPGRLIVCSIYSFLISFMLFFILLLPVGPWSIILLAISASFFIHIVSTFSAFGRVIMHTGAMGKSRVFSPEYEEFLLPHTLHTNLLVKAEANLVNNTSIIRQYRRQQKPIDRHLTALEMYDHLCGNLDRPVPSEIPYRPRADSKVRFADQDEELGTSSSNRDHYHHSRSLTPLSDISSQFAPTPPSSRYSADYRKAFGGAASKPPSSLPPDIPNKPPPYPPSSGGTDPIRAVSSASLEQWLQQGSPAVAATASRENAKSSSTNPRSSPPVPPESRSNSSNDNNNNTTVRTPPPSRTLTEDERFALDYGEFEDGPSFLEDDDDDDDHLDVDQDNFRRHNETTSLLSSNERQENYSSSPYYASTADERNPNGRPPTPPFGSSTKHPRA